MRDLADGPTSAISAMRFVVITGAEQWGAFWADHSAHTVPPPAPPEVDWETRQVVALVLGQRNTGGYSVRIESIERSERGVVVEAHEVRPAPDAVTTMALTSPFHFVSVDRSLDLEGGLDLRLTF